VRRRVSGIRGEDPIRADPKFQTFPSRILRKQPIPQMAENTLEPIDYIIHMRILSGEEKSQVARPVQNSDSRQKTGSAGLFLDRIG
jgi:hypothetical protein